MGDEKKHEQVKFGAFTGVFTPAVLTILGAIMYLREGWMVGNAGLGGAILIIVLAHVITIATGLSVASIATNIRVGAGGAYAIIAQSLGVEAGGAIGVPLYFARVTSAVLYVLAFAEGWAFLYPEHPPELVAVACYVIVCLITYVSTDFATKTQVLILIMVVLSLVSVGLGCFALGDVPEWMRTPFLLGEFKGGLAHTPVFWGEFKEGGFWATFAIFFPAVTGIVAGISLSDVLEDPQTAIPVGTLAAIAVTFVLYLGLAVWLGMIASPEQLLGNMLIMVDRAYWRWAVITGLLGATLSSALGSLVAAPRVMQALGAHGVLPGSSYFAAKTARGEPRHAIVVTSLLTGATLAAAVAGGGLNFVAPLITMFFLLTYGILNLVVLIELRLSMVSFRPTFRVPQLVPLIGMVSCVFVMFLVNPLFSLVSVALAVGIYWYLSTRQLPGIVEGDVRSGLFLSVAEWAAEKISDLPPAPERNWQPNLLVPVTSSNELRGSYRLLRGLTRRQGSVHALGIYPPGGGKEVVRINQLVRDLRREGIFARSTLLEQQDFLAGAQAAMELLRSTFFRPNILFLRVLPDRELVDIHDLVVRARDQSMGLAVLVPDPVLELGTEQQINVWVRSQAPKWELSLRLSNLDLSILLAYQLAWNWEGRITLCMAVHDEETKQQGEEFLDSLISGARLTRWADRFVFVGTFADALGAAPQADLSMVGVPGDPKIESLRELANKVTGSCLFVRDSGDESVLA